MESFLLSFIEEHLSRGKSPIKERSIVEVLTISKGTLLQKVVNLCQKSAPLTINVLKLTSEVLVNRWQEQAVEGLNLTPSSVLALKVIRHKDGMPEEVVVQALRTLSMVDLLEKG